ncbi:MAG: glycosyltransferase family 9 protein [Gemmatimonadaceae bacterium]
MSSLVIQTSFLGDMVLTTPLLERLAERGAVDVVATPANAVLLANHPAVRDVIVFDKRGAARGFRGLKRISNEIRWRETPNGREPRGARVAYLAQGSVRSAWLAILGGIGERVGFKSSAARLFYTKQIPYRRDLHHAVRLWQLASASPNEMPAETLRPSLFPSDADASTVDSLLDEAGVRSKDSFIALAPGSVWATKRWPSYDALANAIAQNSALAQHRVVVIGGAGDTALATAIDEQLRALGAPPAIDATGKLTLLASANLIARAVALVTNDSSPLHLASAMGTPTVALFGPTVPSFGFGPLSPKHAILGMEQLACRPCHAHGPQTCPLGHWKCMRELTPDLVATSLAQLVGRD